MGGGRVPWSISLFFVCFSLHFPRLSFVSAFATHVDASQVFDGSADPFRVAHQANFAFFPLLRSSDPSTDVRVSSPTSGTLPPRFHAIVSTQQQRTASRAFEVRHVGFDDTRTSSHPREHPRKPKGSTVPHLVESERNEQNKDGVGEDQLERWWFDEGQRQGGVAAGNSTWIVEENVRRRWAMPGVWRCRREYWPYIGAIPWHTPSMPRELQCGSG